MVEIQIQTQRLLLRQWRDADLPQLIELNRDPKVMEFVGPPLAEEQTKAMMERSRESWSKRGYGRFAVEVSEDATTIGFIGLALTRIETHFAPAIEIGWRLMAESWGNGYATEGALAVKEYAFAELELAEIVSFTSGTNLRSRRVMEKIGLQRNPTDDFDHPNIATGSPLKRNVLYRQSNNSRC